MNCKLRDLCTTIQMTLGVSFNPIIVKETGAMAYKDNALDNNSDSSSQIMGNAEITNPTIAQCRTVLVTLLPLQQ